MAFDGPFNNVKSLKLNANDNNIVVTDEDFAEIEAYANDSALINS